MHAHGMNVVQVARLRYLDPCSAIAFAGIGCDKNGILISDRVNNVRVTWSFGRCGDIVPKILGKRSPDCRPSHGRSRGIEGPNHVLASREKMFWR